MADKRETTWRRQRRCSKIVRMTGVNSPPMTSSLNRSIVTQKDDNESPESQTGAVRQWRGCREWGQNCGRAEEAIEWTKTWIVFLRLWFVAIRAELLSWVTPRRPSTPSAETRIRLSRPRVSSTSVEPNVVSIQSRIRPKESNRLFLAIDVLESEERRQWSPRIGFSPVIDVCLPVSGEIGICPLIARKTFPTKTWVCRDVCLSATLSSLSSHPLTFFWKRPTSERLSSKTSRDRQSLSLSSPLFARLPSTLTSTVGQSAAHVLSAYRPVDVLSSVGVFVDIWLSFVPPLTWRDPWDRDESEFEVKGHTCWRNTVVFRVVVWLGIRRFWRTVWFLRSPVVWKSSNEFFRFSVYVKHLKSCNRTCIESGVRASKESSAETAHSGPSAVSSAPFPRSFVVHLSDYTKTPLFGSHVRRICTRERRARPRQMWSWDPRCRHWRYLSNKRNN